MEREAIVGFYSGQAGKRSIRDQNKAKEKKGMPWMGPM
jgi:hypothetical protein